MIKKIKKLLGISDLENRLVQVENEKKTLEEKYYHLIKRDCNYKEKIDKNLKQNDSEEYIKDYFKDLQIENNDSNKEALKKNLNAVKLVKKYNFESFEPDISEGIGNPVISIKEFRENPKKYLFKLDKGFITFPVGFNFDKINDILSKNNCYIKINEALRPKGTFSLLGNVCLDQKAEDPTGLSNLLDLASINKNHCKEASLLNDYDFFHNYEGIISYIKENKDIDISRKKETIQALELVRFTYLTAIEIIGKTRIKDLCELKEYDTMHKEESNSEIIIQKGSKESNDLKNKVTNLLLTDLDNTTDYEINQLLTIQSKKQFRHLASEITSKIISNDKIREGLTYTIDKPINEYSMGEALVLSCYFARNVIDEYKTLEDNVKDIFANNLEDKVFGKCTDYTGLAIHYLKEYLIPMQPEKFKDWVIGFDKDHIGDYDHCYIKLSHINKDKSIDVFFADPTVLAASKIQDLKNSDILYEKLEGIHNPILIKRSAEDLMYKANENMEKLVN